MSYIDGFTVCTGPVYASYLSRTIHVWNDTLDSVTVICRPTDVEVKSACKGYSRVRVVETDVFDRHGAVLNKGAALNVGYAAMDPIGTVLHFDSDILPPANWRDKADREFRAGAIYGAWRYYEDGRKIVDDGPWPYGYWQMWSSNDVVLQYWPLFENHHPHAGSYDLQHLEKWPRTRWKALSFPVTHFGEPRSNWCGKGIEDAAEQQKRDTMMANIHNVGLAKTRQLSVRQGNQLKLPAPKLKFHLPAGDPARARGLLRACMSEDPFLVHAYVGLRKGGYETIKLSTPLEHLRRRVQEALASQRGDKERG